MSTAENNKVSLTFIRYLDERDKTLLGNMLALLQPIKEDTEEIKDTLINCRKEHDETIEGIQEDVIRLQGCKIARTENQQVALKKGELRIKRWQVWLVFIGLILTGVLVPLLIVFLTK